MTENIQQQIISCDGGLVLNRDTFTQPSGTALQLQNFEPSIKGGYRRINGTNKYVLLEFNDTNLSTSSKTGSDEMLMTTLLGRTLIAARGSVIGKAASTFVTQAHTNSVTTLTVDDTSAFASSGTVYIGSEIITYSGKSATTFTGCSRGASSSSAAAYTTNDIVSSGWTSITDARTSANKYTFAKYNFNGTDKIIIADGQNYAASYDGSTYTLLNGSTGSGLGTAPTAPESVAVFRNHMFFSKSSSQELVFSAPFAENDYSTANGAGSINVNDKIVGLKSFRDRMFIFCTNRIYVLTGSSLADFALQPITTDIGCLDKFSIQEIGGDIIFLAPDGLRTIAGTEKIGDVELGTISKSIQERINAIGFNNISSVVIREKSQYRVFYPTSSQTETNALGIIATLKQTIQGGTIGWQFGDVKGVKPSCTDSDFTGQIEVILHGGYDGFVYQQENGNTFSGTNIKSFFRSPDIIVGDAGLRKSMQRVIANYRTEGVLTAELRVRYDYDSPDIPQPNSYSITTGAGVALYGLAQSTYATATYGSSGTPLVRQSVEGSGFAVAIKFDEFSGSAPFTLNGFQLEFTAGGRH